MTMALCRCLSFHALFCCCYGSATACLLNVERGAHNPARTTRLQIGTANKADKAEQPAYVCALQEHISAKLEDLVHIVLVAYIRSGSVPVRLDTGAVPHSPCSFI